MPTLIFKKQLDFFGLSSESLDGLRTATKGALTNLVNGKLKDGIKLAARSDSRFTAPVLFIMNDAILAQTDIDVEKEFYSSSAEHRNTRHLFSQ